MLEVQDLSVSYGSCKIVDGICFTAQPGQWLMIVGPNGAGKSTLLSAISCGVDHAGSVKLKGREVRDYKAAELATRMGVLMQHHSVNYSFSVDEVVRLGRYAYSGGFFAGAGDDDDDKVQEALELTGMLAKRDQSVLTLSGGELQRTFLAQLLAQDPELMLLDEPSNHLDLIYQKQVFALVKEWLAKSGRAVISVVHDLSLAKAFGTHALLMQKGKMVAYGPIDTVLCPENLNAVYGMDVGDWMRWLLQQW